MSPTIAWLPVLLLRSLRANLVCLLVLVPLLSLCNCRGLTSVANAMLAWVVVAKRSLTDVTTGAHPVGLSVFSGSSLLGSLVSVNSVFVHTAFTRPVPFLTGMCRAIELGVMVLIAILS